MPLPQAVRQGHNGLDAWTAGRREPELARHFTPTAPNQVWTSDITPLWTDQGGLYLAIVLDLFKRDVVGRSPRPRMTVDIVTDALDHGLVQEALGVGPAAPCRPGQLVRQPCLSGLGGTRHDLLDEPERELRG